jgi:diadenosine tetraphosphate (Ap4A) HIT family hydrolase
MPRYTDISCEGRFFRYDEVNKVMYLDPEVEPFLSPQLAVHVEDTLEFAFHLSVHVIPRYRGDVPDPRGGIRRIKKPLVPYAAEGEV